MRDNISAVEAAEAIGVSPRRVRAMIGSGQLSASRVGREWSIPRSAVDAARLHRPKPGRSWSPMAAWAFLARASKAERPPGCSSLDWSRAGQRLRDRGLREVLLKLASRAAVHQYYAHPSVLHRLHDDPDFVASGVSAAGSVGADLIGLDEFGGYVLSSVLPEKSKEYAFSPSPSGGANVRLRVIDGDVWPLAPVGGVAPPLLVAVDLLESDDVRSRRAGEVLLEELQV